MSRKLALVMAVALTGCGDDGLAPAPPTISAGPVTIDTTTMTLSIDGQRPLEQSLFLEVGTVKTVDPTHYYDPRGDAELDIAMVPIEKAAGAEGDWIVLEGGTKLKLSECAIASCAVLDVDASKHDKAVQLRIVLPRDAVEPIYGTGDAAAKADVTGALREMSLRVDLASHSSLNETHVPVPLVLWPRRGIGMFIADDRPGAIDIGAPPGPATDIRSTFTLPERGAYRIYLYTGASPVELVRQYVALTAKPAVPPRWAFAPQQWRNVHNSSDEVKDDAQQMRTRKIPGSVMWIDNPWQTGYNTFDIDHTRFVGAQQMMSELTAQGYKVLFWSTPYTGSNLLVDHAEGAEAGYFVTDDAGKVVDWPWQNGPGALVDFTRDGATAWWRQRINRVIQLGAAGFKLDFGEELVPDLAGTVVPFLLAGGDNSTHHNRYAAGYHEAYLGALPPGDGFVITRAGAWGEQATNTAIWPGDLDSDFSEHGVIRQGKKNIGGLPSAIARGLSLSVSGYPFYGSDIGGFKGFPTTEVLLRWAQYASLGTIMQLGGGGKSHNPWDTTLFDANAESIYKTYAELHMLLNPLLWTLAQQAGADGTPVTRPAKFIYDCACDDAMFLLGDDILVAPVITAGATTRTAVLPPGQWVDRRSGAVTTANGKDPITVPASLAELPIWYRAGAIVPMFARVADTLLPATMAGVTSYTNPTYGSELRFIYTPSTVSTFGAVHDGASLDANMTTFLVKGGTQYSVITVDVDGRNQAGAFGATTGVKLDGVDLVTAADDTALGACAAPGCYRFDTTTKHLQIRVFAPAGQQKQIQVR